LLNTPLPVWPWLQFLLSQQLPASLKKLRRLSQSMEDIAKWRKAGRIAAEIREYGKKQIKKGESLLETTKRIEEKVAASGAQLAFPVQMSCNEIAAHYYPGFDDKQVFAGQLVCLDVGTHIDGCIGDTAVTVDLSGKYSDLIKAAEKALTDSLRIVKPGVKLTEIGKAIQDAITGMGFQPIRNLSGHGLAEYQIHTHPTVPNYNNGDQESLQEGQIIAVEPFATTGSGLIHEKGFPNLFMISQPKNVRLGFVRDIQAKIQTWNGLPFAKNWLLSKWSEAQVNFALKQFKELGILQEFPPLVERSGGMVSQAEHTLIVGEKTEILTKAD